MADVFTAKKRSAIMAANRGRGNRSTEVRLRARLVALGITGWRLNAKDVSGTPDFAFKKKKLAVFVDGCFWHGCTACKNVPATRSQFWRKKIHDNKTRDRRVTRKLRRRGWTVVRFWEHELRMNPSRCVSVITASLKSK